MNIHTYVLVYEGEWESIAKLHRKLNLTCLHDRCIRELVSAPLAIDTVYNYKTGWKITSPFAQRDDVGLAATFYLCRNELLD